MRIHRLELSASSQHKLLIIGIATLLIVSVWMWQRNILPLQWLLQLALSFLLLVVAVKQLQNVPSSQVVTYDEDGRWVWLLPTDASQWQIQRGSKFAFFMIWLRLKNVVTEQERVVTLFQDSMPDADFRHLRRIVTRINRQPKMSELG